MWQRDKFIDGTLLRSETESWKTEPERLYCIEIDKLKQIGMSSWFGGSNWKFWTFSIPALTIDVDSWWCCIMMHHWWRSILLKWWCGVVSWTWDKWNLWDKWKLVQSRSTDTSTVSVGCQLLGEKKMGVQVSSEMWTSEGDISRKLFWKNSNWTVSGYLTSDKTRFCVKKAKNPGSRTVLRLGDGLHELRFKALVVALGKILWFYKQIIIVIITGMPNMVIIIFSYIALCRIVVCYSVCVML